MWKSRQFVEDWNTSLRPSRRSECVACNMSNLDAGFHSLLVFEVVIFSYLKCLLVSSWNGWRSQMVTMLSWILFSAPRYVYPLLDACIHAVHWRLHGTRSLYFSGCLVKPCDLFVQICKIFYSTLEIESGKNLKSTSNGCICDVDQSDFLVSIKGYAHRAVRCGLQLQTRRASFFAISRAVVRKATNT